jgi:two-component system cell cycle sensor histidine kinase/response regulator CckA
MDPVPASPSLDASLHLVRDAVLMADAESGIILDANPAACRLLGMNLGQLRGMHQSLLHPLEHESTARGHFSDVVERRRSTLVETRIQAADGTVIPVEVSDAVAEIAGRRVVIGVFRDLTERRALLESEARFAEVLRSSPFGVYLYHLVDDDHLILTDSNPAADRITGVANRKMIGLTLEEAFPGVIGTPVVAAYHRCAADGTPWGIPRLDYDHGDIQGSYEVHVYRYAPRRIAVAFVEINERIRLEERLRHGERLESLGRLAGGISHDFNNQLSAILGSAELIGLAEDLAEAKRYAGTIAMAAQRAAQLTRQMLVFSRRGAATTERESIAIARLLSEVRAILERTLPKRVQLEVGDGAGVPPVIGDQAQMLNAIINLAVNAADAMPQGGRIGIAVRPAELGRDEATALYGSPPPGAYVAIEVADEGQGMPPEMRLHLFEPFYTTKGEQGHGLGLASVFGAVTAHGGGIAVRSQPGHGTAFTLYLRVAADAVKPTPAQQLPSLRARVLVIDDEPGVRGVLCDSLRHLGCTVEEAGDGLAGLELWRRGPRFDLVVLDLMMPQMDGAEVFRRLRELDPQMAILLVSGHSRHGVAEELLAAGAGGLLDKPFTLPQLVSAVRAALPV